MRGWRVFLTAMAVWAVGAAPAAAACPDAHAPLRKDNAAKVRRATLCLINKERAEAGLHKVRADRRLVEAASRHSQDMVAAGYFAHDSPDGSTLVTRARQADYLSGKERRWGLAENIAVGQGKLGTAAAIVRQWMRSPGHRANVLLAPSQDAGVGIARGLPTGGPGVTVTFDVGFAN